MASMEPPTKQANRGSGTGAVGGSHGDRRADSESGSCRHAASVDRVAIQLLPAFCLWGGSVCVKHTVVGGIGEPTTSQQAEAARAAASRAALLQFGGG
jgi:hypothetical protein